MTSARTPELSVVVCSLNGAEGVDRCLRALERQTIADRVEAIVVDDGSTDDTSGVARGRGAIVLRHAENRGLAAARNTGIGACSAPIVAFLDDDGEPAPGWGAALTRAYAPADVIGVGGSVSSRAERDGFVSRYLERNNPIEPLELDLAVGRSLAARLRGYLERQWSVAPPRRDRRDVYCLVGANMSFRLEALQAVGGFDERFTFGAEEFDLCLRLRREHPSGRLVQEPSAMVRHHFVASLDDTVRRSRAYGRGSARLYRKWPPVGPTVFPTPLAVAAGILAARKPLAAAITALLLPQLAFPSGIRRVATEREAEAALDAYVKLAQEAAENAGFALGLHEFRDFEPDTGAPERPVPETRRAVAA